MLLADPRAGVVGVAHAGRVGAAAGVLAATLTAMAGLGAAAADCEALLGPAICGACYEVPAAMRDEVEAALPGSAGPHPPRHAGPGPARGSAAQLAALGVARVGVDPRCTVEDPDLYSYRRDRRTGRLAAVTWLDPSRLTRPRVGTFDSPNRAPAFPRVGTFWPSESSRFRGDSGRPRDRLSLATSCRLALRTCRLALANVPTRGT